MPSSPSSEFHPVGCTEPTDERLEFIEIKLDQLVDVVTERLTRIERNLDVMVATYRALNTELQSVRHLVELGQKHV